MCGVGHGAMAARIHIETAAQHAEWLSGRSRQQQLAQHGSPARTAAAGR
ncbi:MAG: hypothetical protein IT378_14270 [Sandaracinaceae bacterium]|nr:hypothetical protein [Sandaracinaceae bacterium]